jgi:hypothetical protein
VRQRIENASAHFARARGAAAAAAAKAANGGEAAVRLVTACISNVASHWLRAAMFLPRDD